MQEVYVGGSISGGEVVGYSFHFTDSDLRSLSMITDLSLVEDRLAADQLIFVADYHYYIAELFAPADFDGVQTADGYVFATNAPTTADYQAIPYATPVYYYADGTLMGKFYLTQIVRSSTYIYETRCVSAVGLMDTRLHYGGVYQGVAATPHDTIGDLIASIMDENGSPMVPYTIDNAVAQEYAYGYLPVATKRQNLHQVLFAYAISLVKNADGSLRFTYLDTDTITPVPDNRIFAGGTVEVGDIATAVEVTEHNYRALSTDRTVTLYDNTNGSAPSADNTLVYFSEPAHDLVANGLTIIDSGANWATLSGVGTLTGKAYTHTTQVLRKNTGIVSARENVKSVTDATMITPLNSANAVNRLAAYYSARKTVHMSMVLDGEKAGDQISFTNPYGDSDAGYLVELDTVLSSFAKAKATVITGYQAQGFGNYYTDYELLTGSGTWTSDVTGTIRVQLFGGGTGGDGGNNGTNGQMMSGDPVSQADPSARYPGSSGQGGSGGNGGVGGNVLIIDINVEVGDEFAYACGVGGDGGAVGSSGSAGTNTTFGAYTTQGQIPAPTGVTNIFTGITYAAHGATGINGGGGAASESVSGESISSNGQTWYGGNSGGYGAYRPPYEYYDYYGGLGGGAAFGANGQNAYVDTGALGLEGKGGAGGDANQPPVGNLGSGGSGGNGGGGGGGGGYHSYRDSVHGKWYYLDAPGSGGNGSAGAKGGNGGILIYKNAQS